MTTSYKCQNTSRKWPLVLSLLLKQCLAGFFVATLWSRPVFLVEGKYIQCLFSSMQCGMVKINLAAVQHLLYLALLCQLPCLGTLQLGNPRGRLCSKEATAPVLANLVEAVIVVSLDWLQQLVQVAPVICFNLWNRWDLLPLSTMKFNNHKIIFSALKSSFWKHHMFSPSNFSSLLNLQ